MGGVGMDNTKGPPRSLVRAAHQGGAPDPSPRTQKVSQAWACHRSAGAPARAALAHRSAARLVVAVAVVEQGAGGVASAQSTAPSMPVDLDAVARARAQADAQGRPLDARTRPDVSPRACQDSA